MQQILMFHTGEVTCSEAPPYPGSMCQFVRTRAGSFGQKFVCHLFDETLFDEDGWLQRCKPCLKQFSGVEEFKPLQ